jgi:hypothetical protein
MRELTRHMLAMPHHSAEVDIKSWVDRFEALTGPQSDNIPILWMQHMLKQQRRERWSAHLIAESIRDFSWRRTCSICILVDVA